MKSPVTLLKYDVSSDTSDSCAIEIINNSDSTNPFVMDKEEIKRIEGIREADLNNYIMPINKITTYDGEVIFVAWKFDCLYKEIYGINNVIV